MSLAKYLAMLEANKGTKMLGEGAGEAGKIVGLSDLGKGALGGAAGGLGLGALLGHEMTEDEPEEDPTDDALAMRHRQRRGGI